MTNSYFGLGKNYEWKIVVREAVPKRNGQCPRLEGYVDGGLTSYNGVRKIEWESEGIRKLPEFQPIFESLDLRSSDGYFTKEDLEAVLYEYKRAIKGLTFEDKVQTEINVMFMKLNALSFLNDDHAQMFITFEEVVE